MHLPSTLHAALSWAALRPLPPFPGSLLPSHSLNGHSCSLVPVPHVSPTLSVRERIARGITVVFQAAGSLLDAPCVRCLRTHHDFLSAFVRVSDTLSASQCFVGQILFALASAQMV